jgi:hypothetical protein
MFTGSVKTVKPEADLLLYEESLKMAVTTSKAQPSAPLGLCKVTPQVVLADNFGLATEK